MGYLRNDQYIKAFGAHLRKMRQDRGLTLEQLEEKTGIDSKQISRLERGERSPTLTTIFYIAKGLGVKPKELLAFDFVE